VTVVVVAPGQGSQSPGFLEPWLADPAFSRHLDELADAAQLDLRTHGTVSDADTIRDTAVAQPLIVAAGIVSFRALLGDEPDAVRGRIGEVAGHSVGELTAAAIAGVLPEGDAMRLVRERGLAMAEAAGRVSTGMSAVIGADEAELLNRLAELGLEPANFNGGGQIVVAGELPALDALRATPPTGARVIPLQVAGAFHTRFMAPAVERLRTAADATAPADPDLPIRTNRDGSRVASGAEFLELVVGQVASPVRWDRTMAEYADAGVTGVIELAPAGALVGLAKRGLKGVPTVAVKTPDDLAAARELLGAAS
jgi:[acyl-carrier-protein] S-malonyltransferase